MVGSTLALLTSALETLIRLLLALASLFLGVTSSPERPALPPHVDAPTVQINSFSVTPLTVTEGDTITVSWDVSGVESVQIALIYYEMPRHGDPMVYPSAGTVTLTAPEGVRGFDVSLSDFVDRYQERVISQAIRVEVACRFTWFHEQGDTLGDDVFCPEAARTVLGHYQRFEGGYALTWEDSYWVWFYLDEPGVFYTRPVSYTGMNPPSAVEAVLQMIPPDGRFLPGDAFANLWAAGWERDNLNWALAPQQTYAMALQPSQYGSTLLALPDGTVIGVPPPR